MTNRIQRNRSRLPEPFRFKSNLSIGTLANYVDDLVKTLRLRLESIEGEMDFQDQRTRIIETDQDLVLDTSTPIAICTNAVNISLPNARDAFLDQAVITIKATAGAVTVLPQSGELIENGINYLVGVNNSITLVSDGDNWWIVSSYP